MQVFQSYAVEKLSQDRNQTPAVWKCMKIKIYGHNTVILSALTSTHILTSVIIILLDIS
jgi:hypothetical protein